MAARRVVPGTARTTRDTAAHGAGFHRRLCSVPAVFGGVRMRHRNGGILPFHDRETASRSRQFHRAGTLEVHMMGLGRRKEQSMIARRRKRFVIIDNDSSSRSCRMLCCRYLTVVRMYARETGEHHQSCHVFISGNAMKKGATIRSLREGLLGSTDKEGCRSHLVEHEFFSVFHSDESTKLHESWLLAWLGYLYASSLSAVLELYVLLVDRATLHRLICRRWTSLRLPAFVVRSTASSDERYSARTHCSLSCFTVTLTQTLEPLFTPSLGATFAFSSALGVLKLGQMGQESVVYKEDD